MILICWLYIKCSDEVGFIHPSQFVTLKEEIGDSLSSENRDHESTSFWIRDHKLGISTQILIPVYKAAKHAFISALRQYKTPGNFSGKSQDDTLAIEVMIHSKALLLLSCDFATAWNSRFFPVHIWLFILPFCAFYFYFMGDSRFFPVYSWLFPLPFCTFYFYFMIFFLGCCGWVGNA